MSILHFSKASKIFLLVLIGIGMVGCELVPVPDYVGQSIEGIEEALQTAGLELGTIEEVFSDSVPKGIIISQTLLTNAMAPQGYPIDFVVSAGPEFVLVPDLTALTPGEAELLLEAYCLVLGSVSRVYAVERSINIIQEQEFSIGTPIRNGSTVDVSVSGDGVFLVDKSVPVKGEPDGLSWEGAFATIQEGIDAAHSWGGGEVWVAAGTYDEDRSAYEDGAIQFLAGVSAFGGFLGSELYRDERDWQGNVTILDASKAQGGQPGIHVIRDFDGHRLDGFIIQGGYCVDLGANGLGYGGGLYGGGPQFIENCTFRNKTAVYGGGVFFITSALDTPQIIGCIFEENAARDGGGISCSRNGIVFQDCVIRDNVVTRNGGGVRLSMFRSSYIRCDFINNRAAGRGGAASLDGTDAPVILIDFIDCTFKENFAQAMGGAFSLTKAQNFLVNRCVFEGNQSSIGGAINVGGGYFRMYNSIFTGNTAVTRAGAMAISGIAPPIVNCTFANNSVPLGGGIYSTSSGSYITNCIFWGNGNEIFASGSTRPVVTHSCVQGGYASGRAITSSDPDFIDPDNLDFRLGANSSCINTGLNSSADVDIPNHDIDGIPRPNGSRVDIGAYEYVGIAS